MYRVYRFTQAQRAELERSSRTEPRGYVRLKALAVLHVAEGRSVREAAEAVKAHRTSVGEWCARYLSEGAASFAVAKGGGRKPRAKKEEVEKAVYRSPREYGLPLTRWTLAGLAQGVSCLNGMTPSGVRKALKRFGLAYKRGQPRLHSPDPSYEEKKGGSTGRGNAA